MAAVELLLHSTALRQGVRWVQLITTFTKMYGTGTLCVRLDGWLIRVMAVSV